MKEEKASEQYWLKFRTEHPVWGEDEFLLHEDNKADYDKLLSLEAKIEANEYLRINLNEEDGGNVFIMIDKITEVYQSELQQLKDQHNLK